MSTTTIDKSLDLQHYYPADLKILGIEDTDNEIIIQMHSVSQTCNQICRKAGNDCR